MTNGKINTLMAGSIALILALLGGSLPVSVWAGNKAQVEKRVEDLDNLNKSIINEIPDLPRYGTVEVKAHVTEDKDHPRVQIIEKDIKLMPEPNEDHSDEKNKETQ